MKDALGDRLKAYESCETGRSVLPYIPCYARIDGRSFNHLTKNLTKPFDAIFNQVMIATAAKIVSDTSARIGYVQSDEMSFVWLVEKPTEQMLFNGKIQKLTSVLAAMATSAFIKHLVNTEYADLIEKYPHFDARVIQLPNREEAANMFLWREMDARKNAISMAAHAHFSHKSLQGLSGWDKVAKMSEAGINFADYPLAFRQGTFIRRETNSAPMTEEMRMAIPEKKRPESGTVIVRSEIKAIDMPQFNRVSNRAAVIFDGAEPILIQE